jgi:hypothetical protein
MGAVSGRGANIRLRRTGDSEDGEAVVAAPGMTVGAAGEGCPNEDRLDVGGESWLYVNIILTINGIL